MRVILSGGGTMGHVSPALAIAEALLAYDENTEILFIGRDEGEENKAIENAGFRLKTIKIHGIARKLSIDNLKNLFIAEKALSKAKKIIDEFSPSVVIGTGGYVCWPVLRAAQKKKIPTAVHESNASPGLVIRLLAPRCDRVLLNLSAAQNEFKKKNNIRIVGNPVRDEFVTTDRTAARKKLGISPKEFLITSVGGSGGSQKINEASIKLMKSHSAKSKNVRHIHATGKKYFHEAKASFAEFVYGKNGCIIKPYIDNMATVLAASDVVITRCGAMTLSELSAVGVPSILVPSPNVTGNHQHKNALLFSECGAGILIKEEELSERALLDVVRELENNIKKREKMSSIMRSFYVKNSKERILGEIRNIAKK